MPTFDEISQSTAEIKLLQVSENVRPPYWYSISGFYFDLCVCGHRQSACHFAATAKFRSNRMVGGGV